MADFCSQCVKAVLHEDPTLNDFVGIAEEGKTVRVLCEGCGYTEVNAAGNCVGACDAQHFRGQRGGDLPGHVDQNRGRGMFNE